MQPLLQIVIFVTFGMMSILMQVEELGVQVNFIFNYQAVKLHPMTWLESDAPSINKALPINTQLLLQLVGTVMLTRLVTAQVHVELDYMEL